MDVGIFDVLMYFLVEYVQIFFFILIDKQFVIKVLDDQIDKFEMIDDVVKFLFVDLKVGFDMVFSGYIFFGKSYQILIVYVDLLECLVKDINIVMMILEDLGLIVIYLILSFGVVYFVQLSGNYMLWLCLSFISSLNFVEMESFYNFFMGKEKGNIWGNNFIILGGLGNDIYNLNYYMIIEY